jgi:hypothetical protein
LSLEPQRTLAQRLTHRYRNAPGVNIVRARIGEERGDITLCVPSYRRYRFDGLASSDEATATDWLRHSVWRFDPSLVTVDSEQIPIVWIDDLPWPDPVHHQARSAANGTARAARSQGPPRAGQARADGRHPDEPIMSFLDGLGHAPCYYVDGKLKSAPPPWVRNVLFIA